jgi:hypothetical protein
MIAAILRFDSQNLSPPPCQRRMSACLSPNAKATPRWEMIVRCRGTGQCSSNRCYRQRCRTHRRKRNSCQAAEGKLAAEIARRGAVLDFVLDGLS